MRIGIVGGGAAGLTSAWLLHGEHDVVVFESSDRPGGHARTLVVEDAGREVFVELGAQFFFESGYSGLLALIERLGLRTIREPVAASMMLSDGRTIVVPPLRPRAIAACASPRTVRELFYLRKFLGAGERLVHESDWNVTIQALVERASVPRDVADRFVVPFIAASWGVTREHARALSAYSVRSVIGIDSALLPHCLRLPRGLSSYIEGLIADSPRADVRLGAPVRELEVSNGEVRVHTEGRVDAFDAVILACDWNNSAAMCARAPALAEWTRAFRAFEDYPVRIAVHRDPSVMPADPGLWEMNNFQLTVDREPRNTMWPGKFVGAPVFRTWMRKDEPEPHGTVAVLHYRHVSVTPEHPKRQAALARLQGTAGIYAAGMYTTGIDNHQSALRSALAVAKKLAPDGERVKWFESRVSS